MNDKKDMQSALWQILEKSNGPVSDEELAKMSELKISRVRATLGKMVKERLVRRAGGGKFCLVSKNSKRK
ncbi:hypothetical protein [Candidatus Uabimicrobium sp. HlEnr_7]|uniref:hypothetical protein n=1 Tax=Candidatus Uabimicrobium helgolandensis TaxID=3095367 RepID=UPI0035569686